MRSDAVVAVRLQSFNAQGRATTIGFARTEHQVESATVRTRQEFVFAPFLNMVLVPVLLLSGILLPMSMAPPWLRTLSRFNPLSHVVDAIRDAFLGRYTTSNVLTGSVAVVVLAVVSVTLATRLFVRENA